MLFLAAGGFHELYITAETFGADWLSDHLTLLAWGFGSQATTRALGQMVQSWNLKDSSHRLRQARNHQFSSLAQDSRTAAASRAWAKSVSDAAELDAAIAEALRVVREERRCALLNVKVLPD